jgi:hypothetical protein
MHLRPVARKPHTHGNLFALLPVDGASAHVHHGRPWTLSLRFRGACGAHSALARKAS